MVTPGENEGERYKEERRRLDKFSTSQRYYAKYIKLLMNIIYTDTCIICTY